MKLACEVVLTRDGTPAMRDLESGEIMHGAVGPRVEAERLYVAASRLATRLCAAEAEPVVVLDVGLGAGSNAIAAWKLAESLPSSRRRLTLVSFDRSLAAFELALSPEHAGAFGFDGAALAAARAVLQTDLHESARTSWQLIRGDARLSLAARAPASADVVFWDPFSPYANPELWTVEIFRLLRRLCRAGASVHTYSRATSTRTALLLAGFAVGDAEPCANEKPGTIAALDPSELERPLDARWLERLRGSRAPFPADAPADAFDRIERLAQFAAARDAQGISSTAR